MGDDAKAADFVASLHDGDEGFDSMHLSPTVGVFHVAGIAIERDLRRSRARRLRLIDHFRKLVNVVRAKDEIEVRHALEKILSLLLGDAATDPYDHSFASVFELLPAAERAVNFLLGLIPHGATVEQNHICGINAVGLHITRPAHDLGDPFRIILIHLAAVGLNIKLFFHWTIKSTILYSWLMLRHSSATWQ